MCSIARKESMHILFGSFQWFTYFSNTHLSLSVTNIMLSLFLTVLCYIQNDLFWAFTIEFLQSHTGPVSKNHIQVWFPKIAYRSSFQKSHTGPVSKNHIQVQFPKITYRSSFQKSHTGPVSRMLCQKKFKTLCSAHNNWFVFAFHYLCYMSCSWWGMSLDEWKYTHVVYDIMEMVIKLMPMTRREQFRSGFTGKGKAILNHSIWSVSKSQL